jgi:site-specific DNA-methyltransferase (adenine-specific)
VTERRVERIGSATLYLGDCLDVLPALTSADAVITDPPYSAEAHGTGRRVLTAGRDQGRARSVTPDALPFPPLTEAQRDGVCRWAAESCKGWMLAFCQAEDVSGWRAAMEVAGQRWVRAMAWVKPDSAPQISGDRPAQGYESIATAWCGSGRTAWNGGGRRGVFVIPKHDQGSGHGGAVNEHPTQKPQRLMRELIALFSNDGQTICDPFMGSGTTGAAAVSMGRSFVGIEIHHPYFELACERIYNATRQERLFA